MRHALLVAIGGAVGALGRHGVSLWARRVFGPGFPYGTLIVNALGCFSLALLLRATPDALMGRDARLLLGTGMLGAFTTFSTFGHDTATLVASQRPFVALGNVALNVGVGLTMTALGWWMGGALRAG